MTQQEQKTVENLISKIADKNYSEAQQALQAAVEAKLKTKIRDYVAQEK